MKKALIFLIILCLLGGILGFIAFNSIQKPNIKEEFHETVLFIPNIESKEKIFLKIQDTICKDARSFKISSKIMSFSPEEIKLGRYVLDRSFSSRQLINKLKAGRQDAVNVTINNVRTLEQLAGKITRNIQLDSITFLDFLNSDAVSKSQIQDYANLMTLFIPNTYQVYWDISSKDLFQRMVNEHNKWWNKSRMEKAAKLEMSTSEIYTLASIVDRESLRKEEKPRIAGVYLNRLKRGIALQADPTVVFAVQDFSIRRVLNKHLEFDSPYNTYIYPGLPPGPIGMASQNGIDAVLDYESHDYIYFCASPEGNGKHLFAKTLAAHNRNAQKFHQWLNSRGIR